MDEAPIVIHGPIHGGDGPAGKGAPAVAAVARSRATAAVPASLGEADGSSIPDVGPSRGAAGVAPPGEITAEPRRAHSLDALRGLFLILMTLGFTIHGSYFPDWMYHRQFPPPGNLVDVPGIAWRD